jgi:hypothetical protein
MADPIIIQVKLGDDEIKRAGQYIRRKLEAALDASRVSDNALDVALKTASDTLQRHHFSIQEYLDLARQGGVVCNAEPMTHSWTTIHYFNGWTKVSFSRKYRE